MKNNSQMRLILHFNIDKTIVMRDSLNFNNTDYFLREVYSQLIWGKIEYKNNEPHFKVAHSDLEYDKKNIPNSDPDLVNYYEYLDVKYKIKLPNEEPNEEYRVEYNKEVTKKKVKQIVDILEVPPGNSSKFKKHFEDMRKKLRIEEKIQIDYGFTKNDSKFDENCLDAKEEMKFSELEEDQTEEDKKIKFRRIFKNYYFKIILPFYDMMIALKKAKREFSLVFRLFGHSDDDVDEFIYEFNHFCNGTHPRYNGEFGSKPKFDGSKGTKDYRINLEKMDNVAVEYRNKDEKFETFAFETLDIPENDDLDGMREDIDEFYEGNNIHARICKGYNNIFLTENEKLSQYCTLVILDDNNFYKKNGNKHGKLMLIDPYDYETLQIFFDSDLDKYPDKIDVVDVATKKKLSFEYCIDKYLVNVEPRKVIMEKNYFLNKIEMCENNRIIEIKSIGAKQFPIQPLTYNFDFQQEIRKLSSDKYLEMTMFPLLHTALNLVDLLRPNEPITFIANFMLKNKNSLRNLEDLVKEIPRLEQDFEEENNKEDLNEMEDANLEEGNN